MRAVLVSTLSITLLASTVSGVVAPAAIVQAAPASAAATGTPAADLDRLRIEGFDAIYSLDYQAARDRFENMTKLAPEDPAGYLYLANNLWLETLNSSRRLLTSVYTSGSFYQEVSKDDRVDAKRDRTFADLIKQAITASQARLAKDPRDARALYYHASAVGLRAAYNTSVKRSFRKAIGDANDSIKLHKQVLVLDPTYTDSYLSIGLYDYVIGSLPWAWRVLARVVGLKGSKKRGIENLEKVVQTGKFTPDDARVVLVGIYNREGQPERSLELLSELGKRYPRNYLFRIEQGTMLFNLNRRDEGDKVFSELLSDQRVASTAADVINYSWGLALSDKGDYKSALERFNAVRQWNKSDVGLTSLSILNAGKSLDAMGKRTEAVAEYQAVLKRENIFDAHKQANEYLKKPFVPVKK
jgi:tetratricopeptide (TPR) repeat protein